MQNLDSLVAMIMKAKYLSHSTILDAKVGSWPSLVWRSILASKDLIQNGVIWSMGDRGNVRVWGNKWLPMPTSFSLHSPKPTHVQNMKVCDLIDREEQQ